MKLGLLSFLAFFLLFASTLAQPGCFRGARGSVCCPETYLCSHNRCFVAQSCRRGSEVCTTNVCRPPGEPRPAPPVLATPPPPPPPSPAPAPAGNGNNGGNGGNNGGNNNGGNNGNNNGNNGGGNGGNNNGNGGGGGGGGGNQPSDEEIAAGPFNTYRSQLDCEQRRRRKEIRDMSNDEWNRFANAVVELQQRPSHRDPNVNQYEDLRRIHAEFVVEAHGGALFLPWHRLFMLLYENLLREIDSDVSVPYWNWSADSDDPALSSIWGRVGSSVRDGNGQPACIPSGQWQDWQTNVGQPDQHCVRRGFIAGQSGSMPRFDNTLTIQALINRDQNYPQFTSALEASHGTPHVGVGGDMGVLGTAPNDPLFYLHHGYVDYIYYQWQRNGHGIPGRFRGTNPGHTGRLNRDTVIGAFGRSVRYAQKLRCVRYEEFSGTFRTASGAMNTSVAELPDEFVLQNHLNETRLAEGHAILQAGLDEALNGEM